MWALLEYKLVKYQVFELIAVHLIIYALSGLVFTTQLVNLGALSQKWIWFEIVRSDEVLSEVVVM